MTKIEWTEKSYESAAPRSISWYRAGCGSRPRASIHSSTSFEPLELLHDPQAGTTFPGRVMSPDTTGSMWSHVSGGPPQYAQEWSNASSKSSAASGGTRSMPRFRKSRRNLRYSRKATLERYRPRSSALRQNRQAPFNICSWANQFSQPLHHAKPDSRFCKRVRREGPLRPGASRHCRHFVATPSRRDLSRGKRSFAFHCLHDVQRRCPAMRRASHSSRDTPMRLAATFAAPNLLPMEILSGQYRPLNIMEMVPDVNEDRMDKKR